MGERIRSMCSSVGFEEFAEAVGSIDVRRWERLKTLGSLTDDFDDAGRFDTRSLPKLTAFCQQHPEFHIVTHCDEGYFNLVRFVNRICYFLADGNKAPDLCVEVCEFCGGYECSCLGKLR